MTIMDSTYPLPDIVGVFLGELRWRMTRWGATAYVIERGPCGGIKSARVLRTKAGAVVCCPNWYAGAGDLIEEIERLTKAKRI